MQLVLRSVKICMMSKQEAIEKFKDRVNFKVKFNKLSNAIRI